MGRGQRKGVNDSNEGIQELWKYISNCVTEKLGNLIKILGKEVLQMTRKGWKPLHWNKILKGCSQVAIRLETLIWIHDFLFKNFLLKFQTKSWESSLMNLYIPLYNPASIISCSQILPHLFYYYYYYFILYILC